MHRILLVFVFITLFVTACANNPQVMPQADLAAIELPGTLGQLGTFSTEYEPGHEGRDTNMMLASDAINNVMIQPGEEFSFNGSVGPTTEKNGYKLAMIYVDGEKSEGYGGGVCQVSSTLYNAAANAGMTIVERHDHSLPVTYVEAGKEAATSYGVKDFRFTNELSYPVVIESSVCDGTVTVSICTV